MIDIRKQTGSVRDSYQLAAERFRPTSYDVRPAVKQLETVRLNNMEIQELAVTCRAPLRQRLYLRGYLYALPRHNVACWL
jgi:hypothetical protein